MQGGKRNGAGRPKKQDQLKVESYAKKAIIAKHGSLEDGFTWLLESEEPSLIKFAFEHAFGKPTEKIEHIGEMGIVWMEKKFYGAEQETDKSD